MQRRQLLKVGLAGAALLAVAGGGAALWQPGLSGTRLSPAGRRLMASVAGALLQGTLPPGGAERERALGDLLAQIDGAVAALPPATRGELSQLLGLMTLAPGRRWFVRLEPSWAEASIEAIDAALQGLRRDASPLRQQAYHALRELVHASWFSRPAAWAAIGYPGPATV
jgi:hypothetical protein